MLSAFAKQLRPIPPALVEAKAKEMEATMLPTDETLAAGSQR